MAMKGRSVFFSGLVVMLAGLMSLWGCGGDSGEGNETSGSENGNGAVAQPPLAQLLTDQRAVYIEFFKEQLPQCSGATEVLLEMKNGQDEELYRLYRFDCLNKEFDSEEFKMLEFNVDRYLDHPPLYYKVGKMDLELRPFFWNGCEVHIEEAPDDWTPFMEWARKWMDIEDKQERNPVSNFQLVVHSVLPPAKLVEGYDLAIDLGTAPSSALIELLNTLEEMGVRNVRIDSVSMVGEG